MGHFWVPDLRPFSTGGTALQPRIPDNPLCSTPGPGLGPSSTTPKMGSQMGHSGGPRSVGRTASLIKPSGARLIGKPMDVAWMELYPIWDMSIALQMGIQCHTVVLVLLIHMLWHRISPIAWGMPLALPIPSYHRLTHSGEYYRET